jgi:hypothetical protein
MLFKAQGKNIKNLFKWGSMIATMALRHNRGTMKGPGHRQEVIKGVKAFAGDHPGRPTWIYNLGQQISRGVVELDNTCLWQCDVRKYPHEDRDDIVECKRCDGGYAKIPRKLVVDAYNDYKAIEGQRAIYNENRRAKERHWEQRELAARTNDYATYYSRNA